MPTCRVCGASDRRAAAAFGGGCARCAGEPLCRRCGHNRRDHRGVYESIAVHACGAATRDEFGWLVGTCGCAGYEPLGADEELSAAPFAEPDVFPPLRIVGRPPGDSELDSNST
jgi:hypothetical protein